MRRRKTGVLWKIVSVILAISGMTAGFSRDVLVVEAGMEQEAPAADDVKKVTPEKEITQLEEGLFAVCYQGDCGFEDFLAQGGASSDEEVMEFLNNRLGAHIPELRLEGRLFGCSTLSVENAEGGYLFGRNFDWNHCDALILDSRPEHGYASVSTVNMDFVRAGDTDLFSLPDTIRAMICMYLPLDGMNEKGLSISVNIIHDSESVDQNTERPDITTTTAIRLLLNQAADVEEAVELLHAYDMHSSNGRMFHFALADSQGRSVTVEYVDNQMVITKTPVVTNFYLAEGEKYGIGTAQSHTRYEMLMDLLEAQKTMTEADVRDALDVVSKEDFGPSESTEWSVVMNQEKKELTYYHRENYQRGYRISIKEDKKQ